jgi:ferredoxin
MASTDIRFSQNAPGAYYVDENCIACDACIMEAAKFFEMNDDDCHAYVVKQPKTASDIEDCENALASCPVDAIGNDGAMIEASV